MQDQSTQGESVSDELTRLREERDEAQDRVLRAQAELENVRKRAKREIEEERRYADIPLMTDLLPVLDNLARAIEAAEKSREAAGLLEGIRMVEQQLGSVLERHNLKRIDAQDQPFDPNLHQAIMQKPTAELPENTVMFVAVPGYMLHDRVIRPAQVIVSKNATGTA